MLRSPSLSRSALVVTLAASAWMPGPALTRERRPQPPPTPEAPLPAHPLLEEEPFQFFPAERAWLGVRISDVSAGQGPDPEQVHGARVTEVEKGSPAERAGLEPGDVIVTYQGQRVESARAFARMLRETPPGRSVRLGVRRGEALQKIDATLEERSRAPRARLAPGFEASDLFADPPAPPGPALLEGPRLGIEAEALGGQLAEYFGVGERGGVLVKEVRPGSAAERASLKAGDVIVRAGSEAVSGVDELRGALRAAEGDRITLGVVRDRAEISLAVDLGERPRRRARAGSW